jgi:hypothetical protein
MNSAGASSQQGTLGGQWFDPDVRPQADFSAHVNGGWLASEFHLIVRRRAGVQRIDRIATRMELALATTAMFRVGSFGVTFDL